MLSADAKLVSGDAYFGMGLPIYGQINGELARNNGYVVSDQAQKVLILSDRLVIAYAGRYKYALEAAEILYGYEQVGGLAVAELDHIFISNTWIPAVKPLLDTISKRVPPEQQIRFGELMTTDEHFRDYPTTVRTLGEWETIYYSPPPKTPWWCGWRSFRR